MANIQQPPVKEQPTATMHANPTKIAEVFMAGAGFMGSAIAYLIASRTECRVHVFDIADESLKKAQAAVEKFGKSSLDKGFISAEKLADATKRITYTKSEADAASADLVIEAIAEDIDAKRALFKRLDAVCKRKRFSHPTRLRCRSQPWRLQPSARSSLWECTSSRRHIMKLLEIIPGIDSGPETVEEVRAFGSLLGKTIITSKDMPGFITTRLGMVLINEAAFALMEGLSTPEEIDLGMTLGYNHPMGPLALADFIGLDIVLHILEVLREGFGDPKYRACPLIKQLVAAGHLGRKTGKGFYEYGG